jgi:outer membrane protein assembly factor BamB
MLGKLDSGRLRKNLRRAGIGLSLVGVGIATCIVAPVAANASPPIVNATPVWSHTLNDGGHPVYFGSPGVGTLDGSGPSVIVGNELGDIYAWHVSDGSPVDGWPYHADAAIQSTPAVSGTGPSAVVLIGVGSSVKPSAGGYLALHANGKAAWYRKVSLLPGNRGGNRGVMSSLAVGPIQSSADVVGGAMGQMQLAINIGSSSTLKGFPWLQLDTNFSSPALADLSGSGHDDIIEGGDSSKGFYVQQYTNGGHIRILSPTGAYGKAHPNGGLLCQADTTQVVQSSPAVGNFLSGAKTGIVVGTGNYFKGSSDDHKLIAIDTSCHRVWTRTLAASSHPSPALADINGDGSLDVVTNSENGVVYALNGANGANIWGPVTLGVGTVGSITTFRAPGSNFQYLLVPTSNGLDILDGRTGAIVEQLATGLHMLNSATVTADPNGSIGITVAGYGAGSQSTIEHFLVNGSSGTHTVLLPGSWPMFHHDPQLTGNASNGPPKTAVVKGPKLPPSALCECRQGPPLTPGGTPCLPLQSLSQVSAPLATCP